MDTLHRIGNRVSCKGPWVQIPPSPLTGTNSRPASVTAGSPSAPRLENH